jgi:transcriptional regulator with XRE-family HTH domain
MSSSRVATSPDSGSTDTSADAMETLARSVARLRRASGLTLTTVAAEAGLSPAYVSQIESGLANPTLRTLALIAKGLGCGVGDLFGSDQVRDVGVPFPPRFGQAPLIAELPGHHGIWDLTADGADELRIRLVHGHAADHADPVRHGGEEFIAVVRGRCRVAVGSTVRVLRPGDTCHLAARDEHRITEPSDDLLMLAVITED